METDVTDGTNPSPPVVVGVSWTHTPPRERWAIAWGVLWRTWVIGLVLYAALLVASLLLIAIVFGLSELAS